MKPCIMIENTQTEKRPFRGYKSILREAIEKVLCHEKFEKKAEVSVTLVSSEEIRRLNKEFRNVDRVTDVLSFPMDEDEAEEFGGAVFLGDIIVCPQRIAEQAPLYETSFEKEFSLMVIHSTLHLLGYDHMEKAEKKEMFALQERIFFELYGEKIQTEQHDNDKE